MSDSTSDLGLLQSLLLELQAGRQEFDFQLSSLVSHARDYASDIPRLRKYAKQVVGGRIMILLGVSRMTTQGLLQTFLAGVDLRSPFPLLLAARVQLELFAVIANIIRVVRENSGEHEAQFVERVERVDQALINATFGTRSEVIEKLMGEAKLSQLRDQGKPDHDVLKAKNVLTRLQRLAASGLYDDCKEDYERLCEYVHPNFGLNMLLLIHSPLDARLLRLSHLSKDPFDRAVLVSARPMARSSKGCLAMFDQLEPPFGHGQMTYL
jgi:hypothetical protein